MTDHVTRERLLHYVDGELSRSAIAETKEHLQSCWSCRVELDRLEKDIGVILDAHNQVFMPSLPDPPQPWPRMEPKLDASDESHRRPFFWRRVAPIAAEFLRPPYTFATAALVMLLIISLISLQVTPVSAAEVLRQVEAADARRLAITPRDVICQRVRVRKVGRDASGAQTSTLESWKTSESSYWNLGQDAVNSELLKRYQANGIAASLPLSSVAIKSWVGLAGSAPVVSREDDGTLNIRLVSNGPARSRGLEEVSFHVQPQDWGVNELMLSFSDATFDITKESFALVDKARVPRGILAALEPAALSLRAPVIASAPRPIHHAVVAPNLDDVEVDVRYRLHGIGADLGESIEVIRAAGQVVVDAWPVSPSRKAELARALEDKPGVRLEFQPPVEPAGSKVTAILPRAPSAQQPDQRLTKFFGSPETEEDYTRAVLQTRKALLAHLYALRTLASRWPVEAEAHLSAPARDELSWMVLDHAAGVRFALLDLHATLNPLLEHFGYAATPVASQGESSGWQDSAATALEAARSMERTLLSLLTTSDQPASVDEALPKLQRELQALDRIVTTLPASDQ